MSMIHVGDITKLNGAELPVVDVITGGSPCQDLSVAGKRAGLAGERSGLFVEQVRIVKEMRERDRSAGRTGYLTRPRYMLWENVPGAFSSNKGEDFRAVLEEIAKVEQEDARIPRPEGGVWPYAGCVMGDGWSIAWRLHDAQFWGVPQRRKRIALVADFGGQSAPEILFERKGMRRDPEESGETREGAAADAQGSTGKAISFQSAVTYRKQGHPRNAEQGQGWEQTEINDTLNAFDSGETRTPTVVMETIGGEVAGTLDASYYKGCGERHGIERDVVVQSAMAMQAIGEYKQSEAASSLKMRDYKDATDLVVSYGLDRASFNQGENAKFDFSVDKEKVGAHAGSYKGPCAQDLQNDMANYPIQNSIVRRLTPLECERLQGFPDGWTDIGEWTDSKGKMRKCSDSARYKALGNSIAIPFWFYILRRMAAQYERPATLGSLFDGIGGFPLCWERCNGPGTAIWASEIEEFPIAVTKRRFGDGSYHWTADYRSVPADRNRDPDLSGRRCRDDEGVGEGHRRESKEIQGVEGC